MGDEMTNWIFVTHKVEGVHFWAEAPDCIKILKNPHRHLFHVRLDIEVYNDDREIEFILCKRWLIKVCDEVIGKSVENPIKKSCEMFANEIINKAVEMYGKRMYRCEVSEDGENGAVVNRSCQYEDDK